MTTYRLATLDAIDFMDRTEGRSLSVTSNRQSELLAFMKAQTSLLSEDLMVVDVGCSQGLPLELRQFEPALAGVGFDPLENEIARLTIIESNSKISYVAAWIEPDGGCPQSPQERNGWRARSSSTAALNGAQVNEA